jgi:hypothetical protein
MTAAALLLAAACGTSRDVTIRVTDADGDITAMGVWDVVDTLSLEAIATAGRCRLRHECPPYRKLRSVEDVEEALRYAGVLLELDADEAQILVLNGRPQHNCFPPREGNANNPVMCAFASLDHAPGGVIELELVADVDGSDRCPESLMACP